MGRVVDGQWTEGDTDLIRNGGFERRSSSLDKEIEPKIINALINEPGRFHLIASQSCPWSHRTLIMSRVSQLLGSIPIQLACGHRDEGYPVDDNRAWALPGTNNEVVYMHEIYTISDKHYTGRASVPVLWDSCEKKIVSNDSLEIVKAFDVSDTSSQDGGFTLQPDDLKSEIDNLNRRIFTDLANGVYRAGLARCQSSYNDSVEDVFEMLDLLEARLARCRLMFGQRLTLSDIILFPVLVRFDIVYNTHFRCTRRRLIDYPNLWAYARDLFSWKPFSADVDFSAIQAGYFLNDGDHNPHKIIAQCPETNWLAPHDRATFGPPLVSLRSGKVTELHKRVPI
ncbi:glutathione S-transferase C-terminal domain-containing protein [Pseudophaeobacter sp.]|uniref:glutathione S-transferase C-terminal domain-containing protein n=1 Tax=Pseudophaeobacter sp. TaxID=1971739 RepID=UPI003298E45D